MQIVQCDAKPMGFGRHSFRQNLTEKAIEEYHSAVQKDPNSLSALMGSGIIYHTQKKYDKAIEYYQKALKINPKFSPAANNLAFLYTEKGENIDEALTLAQMAKEQFPDDPHVSDTLGWVYYKKNIFTRAITYLSENLSLPLSFDKLRMVSLVEPFAKEG